LNQESQRFDDKLELSFEGIGVGGSLKDGTGVHFGHMGVTPADRCFLKLEADNKERLGRETVKDNLTETSAHTVKFGVRIQRLGDPQTEQETQVPGGAKTVIKACPIRGLWIGIRARMSAKSQWHMHA
jgi:hypothetical protein